MFYDVGKNLDCILIIWHIFKMSKWQPTNFMLGKSDESPVRLFFIITKKELPDNAIE